MFVPDDLFVTGTLSLLPKRHPLLVLVTQPAAMAPNEQYGTRYGALVAGA